MSLLSWLNWYKAPTQPFLPDPNKEGSHEPGPKCDCDNAAVYLSNFFDSCLQSPFGKQAVCLMLTVCKLLATNFGKQLNLANSLVFAKFAKLK